MLKRPEKKVLAEHILNQSVDKAVDTGIDRATNLGYNFACNIWEAYHKQEIIGIEGTKDELKLAYYNVDGLMARCKDFEEEIVHLKAKLGKLPSEEEIRQIVRDTGAPHGLPLSLSEMIATAISKRIRGKG